MKTLNEMLEKQMNDENFRKEYEEMQPEFDVIRAIVDARTSQNLTQKELAERTGIDQADISKLENGTRNPSVNLLKRLAGRNHSPLRCKIASAITRSSGVVIFRFSSLPSVK